MVHIATQCVSKFVLVISHWIISLNVFTIITSWAEHIEYCTCYILRILSWNCRVRELRERSTKWHKLQNRTSLKIRCTPIPFVGNNYQRAKRTRRPESKVCYSCMDHTWQIKFLNYTFFKLNFRDSSYNIVVNVSFHSFYNKLKFLF